VSAPDLAARANALYTAAIADILDRRGLTSQTLRSELVPLRHGIRLAGPAYPIKGRPASGAKARGVAGAVNRRRLPRRRHDRR
jgi:hypothetical protein